MIYLGLNFFGFILIGVFSISLMSLSRFEKFIAIISLNIFSAPYSCSLSLGFWWYEESQGSVNFFFSVYILLFRLSKFYWSVFNSQILSSPYYYWTHSGGFFIFITVLFTSVIYIWHFFFQETWWSTFIAAALKSLVGEFQHLVNLGFDTDCLFSFRLWFSWFLVWQIILSCILNTLDIIRGFLILFNELLRWLSGKETTCNAGATGNKGSIPGLGRYPGGGHGNPLRYSCLGYPPDRGAWQATVHELTKSWSWLKQLSTHSHSYLNIPL